MNEGVEGQGRAQGGAKGQSAPPEHLRGGKKGKNKSFLRHFLGLL